jgi:hypothetical protein
MEAPGRNRNWVWVFVVLALLGAAAIGINWAYNARQQLTMDQVAAAQQRWEQHGPRDYDLEIAKEVQAAGQRGEPDRDRITVQVRNGKAVGGTINGRPLDPWLPPQYDMPGWLGFVEEFVDRDTRPGAPRTFRAAEFDPATGALQRFRRYVRTTRERQEVVIALTPANPAAGP